MSQIFELEQLYLQAKDAYYAGTPIMSDDEFDRIEQELLSAGSTAPHIVGADDRKAKYTHPSSMLSLAKYQATIDGIPPTAQAIAWMLSTKGNIFEATPKFDGNAANVIYTNGKLLQVLSRGADNKGRDITDKVKHSVPAAIDILGTVEIRGEVVLKVSTFNEKYSAFKNPRNLVAGILNRDDNPAETIADIDFVPVEVRQHTDNGINYVDFEKFLSTWEFNKPFITTFKANDFESVYKLMEDYRINKSPYQLDGFVIKTETSLRTILGENSHDPNWAIAIKFPPKEAITKIISISWQYGKTGELTPVAVMDPIDLDGSTVSRAALFNYGYLINKGACPGAIVAIAKSGDIIPQITRVITAGDISKINHPDKCQCGAVLKIEGIHLFCPSDDCSVKNWHKFYLGVRSFGLDGVGGALIQQFWKAGFTSPLEFLDPQKMDRKRLISLGVKDGKILDNMYKELAKVKELRPKDIIITMGIDGMGNTIATQLGNYLSDVPYDFKGLEKAVIAGFEPGGAKRAQYERMIEQVKSFVTIVMPEKISADSIGCEFTGSPKSAGFKTKEEFLAAAKAKGYHHTSLKDAKVLFVDDLNSSSSKMTAAKAKGLKIMLYSEI